MGWDDLEVGCERLVSRVGSMEEKEDKHRRGYCGTGETEGGGNGDLAPSGEFHLEGRVKVRKDYSGTDRG